MVRHRGTFQFDFADDGRSFEGTWGCCGEPHAEPWTGELVEPAGRQGTD